MGATKTEQVRFRATQDDILRLKRLADLLEQTRSGILRYLIRSAEIEPPGMKPITPQDRYESVFVYYFGIEGQFQNVTQQRDYRRLAKQYDKEYLLQLMHWAGDKGQGAFFTAAGNSENYRGWMQKQAKQMV
jgi:hypothetical protein